MLLIDDRVKEAPEDACLMKRNFQERDSGEEREEVVKAFDIETFPFECLEVC